MSSQPFVVERVRRRPGAPPLRPLQSEAAAAAAPAGLADELEAFANRLHRLRAIGRNGDALPFYEDRSQAARDAADFAIWARKGRAPSGFMPAAQREANGPRTSYAERR